MSVNQTGAPQSCRLPDSLAGHWDSAEGREMAEQYLKEGRHQQTRGEMSDMALANRQYMVGRGDLDLVVWQTAAKERIRWLSAQLAAANRLLVAEGRGTGADDLLDVRDQVAKLYCAAGCSCCRNDEAWHEASDRLGELLAVPRHDDDSGVDWYAARDDARARDAA